MAEDLIHRIVSIVNPEENGGEQVSIITEFYHTGDPRDDVLIFQKINLESYMNSVNMNLGAVLTPEFLRNLADDIEQKKSELKILKALGENYEKEKA